MPNISWEDSALPRILLIDDNPSVHEAFDVILRGGSANAQLEQAEAFMFGNVSSPTVVKPAYQTDHAFSGAEGVEKVRQALAAQTPYQVVFVDIRMPGMDGVETIERFWKLDPEVQTVICTAYADYRWEDLVNRLGRTDRLLVLKKPFHDIEVMQLASTLARKWSLARQAAMKLEQAELLVSRRTQKLLEIQQQRQDVAAEAGAPHLPPASSGLKQDESSIRESSEPTASSTAEFDLPVVLFVSAESDARTLIRQSLASGYSVCEESSAAQGLRSAKENIPDLIVVDEDVSAGEGMNLCADLKRDSMTSHIPVILLARNASEKSQVRALETGVNEFLTKPLRLSVLKARADNLLESRRKLHEHFQRLQTVQPREMAANQLDTEFLRRTVEIVEKNLADYEFDVEKLARQLGMSRRQLFRKFNALAGCTPNVFMRDIRLRRAAHLLSNSRMTISEIIYAVGFSDPKYFRNIFRERFGVLPGEFQRPLKTPP